VPFGKYHDFDDCVRQNADKADPEAYCATVERRTQGSLSGQTIVTNDRLIEASSSRPVRQFHLKGQHDQQTHGRRGSAGETIPGIGDVDAYLAANPQEAGEAIFVWHGRLVDGLPAQAKHDLLFQIRERYEPVEFLVDGMKRWREQHGLPEPRVTIGEVPAPLKKGDAVAKAFEDSPDMSGDPRVQAAFTEFKAQNEMMWDYVTRPEPEGLGIEVEFWTDPDPANFGNGPYADGAAQAADLRDNRRIKLEAGLGGAHDATMTGAEYDRFRAVHDVFGHAGVGTGFDRHGEYQAYLVHSSMYWGDGQRAMASEYHGVNASVWGGAPGSPGTGKSVLLPERLIENPWMPDGTLRPLPDEAELQQYLAIETGVGGVDYLIEQAEIRHPFAQMYEASPFHFSTALRPVERRTRGSLSGQPATITRDRPRARTFRLPSASSSRPVRQFHLQGQHDQQTHGRRGKAAVKGAKAFKAVPKATVAAVSRLGKRKPPSAEELMGYDPVPSTRENEQSILRHLTKEGQFTPERKAVHDKIIAEALTDENGELRPRRPEGQRSVLIMGGGAASGKTSALNAGNVETPEGAATVNPDEFKIALPEARGPSSDGKEGNGLADKYPDEWAGIVHEESSHVAKRAIDAARALGLNVVVDKVNGKGGKAVAEIRDFQAAGYDVQVQFVTRDIDSAMTAAVDRARKRGRSVEPEVIREGHDGANQAYLEVVASTDVPATLVSTFPPRPDGSFLDPVLTARSDGAGRLRVLDRPSWEAYTGRLTSGLPDDIEITFEALAAGAGMSHDLIHSGGKEEQMAKNPARRLPTMDLDRLPALGRIAMGISPDPGNLSEDEETWVEHFRKWIEEHPGEALDFPL
jgi:chloramphenicol 3-O-phosphotransferase